MPLGSDIRPEYVWKKLKLRLHDDAFERVTREIAMKKKFPSGAPGEMIKRIADESEKRFREHYEAKLRRLKEEKERLAKGKERLADKEQQLDDRERALQATETTGNDGGVAAEDARMSGSPGEVEGKEGRHSDASVIMADGLN
jgi:hypothetical protein